VTLAIVPVFMREPSDLEVTLTAVRSIRETAPDVELLLIDDCSPAQGLVDELEGHAELWRNAERLGFSQTINRGLARALSEGQDAVLVNADIEMLTPGWDRLMAAQDASVVGALLLYPDGELVQHAGVFFSLLVRIWDHRFRYAPATLPEVLEPCVCPVTGAFQYIRHECLQAVGLYDERYRMAWEDVQFCLRVFASGRECRYCPDVRAIHHESLFRGRADREIADWQRQSLATLMQDMAGVNVARFTPEIV
jgi:O-antigen biosynthesis protein